MLFKMNEAVRAAIAASRQSDVCIHHHGAVVLEGKEIMTAAPNISDTWSSNTESTHAEVNALMQRDRSAKRGHRCKLSGSTNQEDDHRDCCESELIKWSIVDV